MLQPTPYQYVKLGSNLEFLRGLSTTSIMQTTSLVAFPNLMENLPGQRYSALRVVGVLKSLLVQLEEMKLAQSLRVAEAFGPMIKEMEDYLQRTGEAGSAYLHDPFAERLIAVAKQVAAAVRSELGMIRQESGAGGQGGSEGSRRGQERTWNGYGFGRTCCRSGGVDSGNADSCGTHVQTGAGEMPVMRLSAHHGCQGKEKGPRHRHRTRPDLG